MVNQFMFMKANTEVWDLSSSSKAKFAHRAPYIGLYWVSASAGKYCQQINE